MRTNPAEKACHTCRRRRLKCDRTVPACQKCARTGQECLGYGKLFLWNHGVASRGKMMGKTYPVPAARTDEGREVRFGQRERCIQRQMLDYDETMVSLHVPLLDPLYQGLDHAARQYLFHFATTLCSELVISDGTDTNPFRNLVPLCRDHPILLHAIIANAALHVSCLHHRARDHPRPDNAVDGLWPSVPTEPCSRAMVDALSAKHKALVLLRQALEDIPNIDADLVVTVVHLFITFELISPGEDEWRAHVQGALRLISYLQTLESQHVSPAALIRDRITSDCLTYYVLGCTLMNTGTLSDPFLLPGNITAALTRAEAASYLSLPTPLLQILFKACELSNLVSVATMTGAADCTSLLNQASTLLAAAQSFDVNAWASSLEGTPSSSRTLSRIHTALAHQNAVRIYICRSVDQISSSSAVGEDTEALVTSIITHLSLVGVTDPIFKATSWPTFIAGAETDNPVYRRWAVERLREFWHLIPWGYLKTAVEVMQTTWRLRDGGGEIEKGSWIQQLKGLERYWLIA
ncbi:fungal-specific transcription factor domain-containing protein [Aspergillus aurantiobrunneus]